MKTVYFVRHGSTEGNQKNEYQHYNIPLSPEGRAQAEAVAERFTRISVDVLLASDMSRALETATIIGKKIGKPVVEMTIFHEMLRPSVVRGKSKNDPEVLKVIAHTEMHFANPDESSRHSDEENFLDLKKRAKACLEMLINRPEDSILVVTHGTFLQILMIVMMQGDNADHTLFESVNNFLYPSNTGITKCTHTPKYDWTLMTWNDHEHLG